MFGVECAALRSRKAIEAMGEAMGQAMGMGVVLVVLAATACDTGGRPDAQPKEAVKTTPAPPTPSETNDGQSAEAARMRGELPSTRSMMAAAPASVITSTGARPKAAAPPSKSCGCTPGDPLCSCVGGINFSYGGPAGGAGLAANAREIAAARSAGAFSAPESGAPAAARLDPNARYATTYRPGGAALAAFDAAVSHSQIPAPYRDLVGDFGARYAPPLAAPTEGALAIDVVPERAAVGPKGGSLNLVVTLASSDATPARAPLSVHVVLDVSGSMVGQPIEDAKHAAEAAVEKLEPADDFSMVTFSSTAQTLVGDGPIGPRRSQVLAKIRDVRADGGTNISSGLDLAYVQARGAGVGDEAVRIVMLLSDGHANAGDTDPTRLSDRAARAFQDGIQTSAFGLGPDYDAPLMSGIADRGAGGYYYLAESSQIEPALAREIDARLRPVATALELRIRLRPDISASRVFGSRELTAAEATAVRGQEIALDQHEKSRGIASDRETDAVGGMRFFIPAFARADRHATMVTLELPPGTGERNVASVECRYKDRVLKRNMAREIPVKIRWAASDAASASTASPEVERLAQAFAAGDAILDAAARVDRGDRDGASALLAERADVMRMAAATLHEPRLVEDADRVERLGAAVFGAHRIADPLPLVVMLRGSGYGYL